MANHNAIVTRYLGLQPYTEVWAKMQAFTDSRMDGTPDELWLVQHSPVFTLGQAGKREHLLDTGDIPVVKTDRGGQVTYHGPGQLVVYPLLNLRRLDMGVRQLVTQIELGVVNFLADWGLEAAPKAEAPGVYIDGRKIASLGLRVRRGCSFHGVSLNIDMDLSPFLRINPCGFQGLQMTQLADYVAPDKISWAAIERQCAQQLALALGYQSICVS